jgi:hypothetical protein
LLIDEGDAFFNPQSQIRNPQSADLKDEGPGAE